MCQKFIHFQNQQHVAWVSNLPNIISFNAIASISMRADDNGQMTLQQYSNTKQGADPDIFQKKILGHDSTVFVQKGVCITRMAHTICFCYQVQPNGRDPTLQTPYRTLSH